MRDKVRHLLGKYKEALKWRDETGQGIRITDGETTFEGERIFNYTQKLTNNCDFTGAMKKRYPYFSESEEVWGAKVSLHVPYTSSSDQTDRTQEDPSSFALVPVSADSGLEDTSEITVEELDDT